MSSSSLNVIALISGGKDSLFSILHCLKNGHKIIALGNLYPTQTGTPSQNEDSDSFMYQTIGHSVIPLYAECLNLPLYRQEICGGAVDTSANYSPPASYSTSADVDEAESLIPLLTRIIAAHPTANALSTGAILSSYQRTRIESVALRLGLTPLAYLWQYPLLPPYSPTSLLEDMAAVSQEARIIKVASGGLGESHLWADVADPKTVGRLVRDMGRFEEGGEGAMLGSGSVLGEGGEYETLAVDGPGVLWKRRILVEEGKREVVGGEGGSAAVRIKEVKTVEKDGEGSGLGDLRVPDMLDVEFEEVLRVATAKSRTDSQLEAPTREPSTTTNTTATAFTKSLTTTTLNASTLNISNLTSTLSAFPMLLATLTTILAKHNLVPAQIIHTTLLLRDISSFQSINKTYATLFPNPLPPSRVTVAVGSRFPADIDISASFTVSNRPIDDAVHPRRGLHVQSRSYWAPANIGPYSQAICEPVADQAVLHAGTKREAKTPEFVYVAGQIPLLPASMTLVRGCAFELHAVLALQHLWRVGRAVRVDWWTGALAYVACVGGAGDDKREVARRARVVGDIWKAAHAVRDAENTNASDDDGEDGNFDVGDAALRRPWGAGAEETQTQSTPPPPNDKTKDKRTDARAPLPNWSSATPSSSSPSSSIPHHRRPPPCFVAEVAALPLSASVEWTSVGIHGALTVHSSSTTEGNVCVETGLRAGISTHTEVGWEVLRCEKDWERCVLDAAREEGDGVFFEIWSAVGVPGGFWERGVRGVSVVPCRSVWTGEGEEIGAVVRVWVLEYMER